MLMDAGTVIYTARWFRGGVDFLGIATPPCVDAVTGRRHDVTCSYLPELEGH